MSDEERKVAPVVKGQVTRTKRTKRKVFLEDDVPVLISGVKEMARPRIQDGLADILKYLIDKIIYKNNDDYDGGYYRSGSGRSRRQDYTRYFDSPSSYKHMRDANGVRSRYDVDELGFRYKSDADKVLDILCEELAEYGKVTVGAYYSACDVSPTAGDFNYGWYDLRNARVTNRGGKWYVIMPRCVAIEK